MLDIYELEQQIEAKMATGHIPGFALAIVQKQKVCYARGFGVTAIDVGRPVGLPVTPQTLFRIGSVTKPLTGTLVMRLVEAGKLDLDAPVKTYVPWLTFSEAGTIDQVTLRMLMSHTAGLITDAEHFGPRDPSGLEAFVRDKLPEFSLVAPPGKLWSYSNPGIILVGYIAEVLGEKPYTELMQELVFDPLQMSRTTFDPTVAMTYPLAQSHDLDDGVLTVQHRFADNTGHYPAGFAMSTVLDLANFAMMQLNQGIWRDEQILSPESVAEMQRGQANMYTLDRAEYGLTFFSQIYKGVRRVQHGGGISTFVTAFEMIPEADVAVVAMANRSDKVFEVGDLVDNILDQVLDLPSEKPKPRAVPPETALWPKYTGAYVGDWGGLAVIRVVNDHLSLDLNGQTISLEALNAGLYFGQKPDDEEMISVGFIEEKMGSTQYIILNAEPCKRIKYNPDAVPDRSTWATYTGQYHSDEDTITVRLEGDRLLVYSKFFDAEAELIYLAEARFACQFGLVAFQMKQDDGGVSLEVGGILTLDRVE